MFLLKGTFPTRLILRLISPIVSLQMSKHTNIAPLQLIYPQKEVSVYVVCHIQRWQYRVILSRDHIACI